MNVRQAAHNK